jgi:ferredoxin
MVEELRVKARELLKSKQVELVIGYQRVSDGVSATPCFIEDKKDADLLIWDAYCVYNLSSYLKDHPGKKIGIVAKYCDLRSIVVLLQENQLKRENLFIIEMECHGVIDEKRLQFSDTQNQEISFAQKCKSCQWSKLSISDYLIKDKGEKSAAFLATPDDYDEYGPIRKMEAKAVSERLKFWQEEFSRCIRCYACRQVCPMCYCPKCVAEQTQPSWFSKATNLEGNFSWNVTRAMHLAGRCIDCGECERACPVGIPLRDINKKIEKDVKELFSYEAGSSVEAKPLFACFDKNDPEGFIK